MKTMKTTSINIKQCKTIKALITTPLLLFYFCFSGFAQPLADSQSVFEKDKATWMVNPYEKKVFIENKGQFDGKDNQFNSKIIYGVDNLGYKIYFTPKGLTYRFDIQEAMTNEEQEKPFNIKIVDTPKR